MDQAPTTENSLVLHGVALNICDIGVVITGSSSIGKSELALELITRGHALIADDAVNISKVVNHLVIQSNQHPFIHVRGIGFLNISKLYANQPLWPHQLDLIVKLTDDPLPEDRLCQLKSSATILNTPVTQFELPVGQKRPLAILIELITKYHRAFTNGYDSNQDFIIRQLDTLQGIT